jgi:hypothetical protein
LEQLIYDCHLLFQDYRQEILLAFSFVFHLRLLNQCLYNSIELLYNPNCKMEAYYVGFSVGNLYTFSSSKILKIALHKLYQWYLWYNSLHLILTLYIQSNLLILYFLFVNSIESLHSKFFPSYFSFSHLNNFIFPSLIILYLLLK